MIPVHQHEQNVAALLGRTERVRLPIAETLGMVLAEDVRAPIALPSFDNSAMDGYAVRAADIAAAPVELPVTADIPAGRTDVPTLEPGTAHRIMTGAPVPQGADTIVQVERTDAGTERVLVREAVPVDTHIRRAGEDVTAGADALAAGTELTPSVLGLAGALGLADLSVYRRPRVLVVSTGSELVPAGTSLRTGQIYDSNGLMLASAVREAGAEALTVHAVADEVPAFLAALRTDVDLILTSGGVSAGAYEVVKDALTAEGVTFTKVAMQPGGPQGAGRYRGVPVVTLPGNPVSSLVSFEVFVRPVLRAAAGHPVTTRLRLTARLAGDLSSPAGKRQYRRGIHRDGTVRVVGGPGSHLLGALASANCLLEVPEEAEHLPAGTEITCLDLR
ncbi:molybdopterin molybdotransferase MoeA [Sciscionella sediminilitoris]|uniref:molybdopterin molybdotransferase MoeA n=1 Tax=Sciscionella sediminilitoris TaxID=1445613 RepID=UPI0004DF5E83|nr:gephyrin-like molybdotransferase Glp [Sciscionella sp. SE31]